MDKELNKLEALLRQEIEAQELLLAAMHRKLQALREANKDQVVACCRVENEYLQKISEMAKVRLQLAALITQQLQPQATAPLRLGELALRLPEPAKARILVLRHQLKERMDAVCKEAALSRQITEALVRHMVGLVRSVGAAISGVNTYGRRGAVVQAATVVSTFSLTA